MFPEYTGVPVFISGESYAGAYIPHIADHIVQYNLDSSFRRQYWPEGEVANENLVNLQGVAIGNGIIDFIAQV